MISFSMRLFVTVSLCRSGNPEAVCFAVNFRSGGSKQSRRRANSKIPQQPRMDPPSQIRCATSPIASGWRIPTKLPLGKKKAIVFLCGPMKLRVCGRWAGTPSQIRRARSCGKSGKIGRLQDFACLWSKPIASEYFPVSANRDPSKRTGNKSRKMRAPWAPDIRFPRLSGDTAVSVLLAVQLAK